MNLGRSFASGSITGMAQTSNNHGDNKDDLDEAM